MSKRFYITTPIYYPSSVLHLGHAYTTVIADVLARYKRSKGFEVFFLTGSDEHGQKIAKKAESTGLTPKAFVDQIIIQFQDLWQCLDISYDSFIRTTDKNHQSTVQQIFSQLLSQGDIYLGEYNGWYCISCEEFVTETQINAEDNSCLTCGTKLTALSEASYFFKISNYTQRLLDYYDKHQNFIFPETRKTEMVNTFIKNGLTDLSVSRTTFNWGIPVIENNNHVIYVWIDALSNYLSALGYRQADDSNFQKFWADPETEIVQLVGKEITRFHAIYWPILLMSLKLRQPNRILSHGWIVNQSGKMSKSKGNVVDPRILIKRYGSDAVRCFLIKEINFGHDGKYSHELFCQFYNAYMVNDLGNLVSRTVSMIEKYHNGNIQPFSNEKTTDYEQSLIELFATTIADFDHEMNQYQVTNAINIVWKLIAQLNKAIDISQPWVLYADNKKVPLANILNLLANGLVIVSELLKPILITTSQLIKTQFGLENQIINVTNNFDLQQIANCRVKKNQILFQRLKIDEEIEYLNQI